MAVGASQGTRLKVTLSAVFIPRRSAWMPRSWRYRQSGSWGSSIRFFQCLLNATRVMSPSSPSQRALAGVSPGGSSASHRRIAPSVEFWSFSRPERLSLRSHGTSRPSGSPQASQPSLSRRCHPLVNRWESSGRDRPHQTLHWRQPSGGS